MNPTPTDRLNSGLVAFARSVFPGFDYHARYPGAVVQQVGQTIDFQPDDPRIPGMSGIEIDLGVPGVTVTVLPKTRCMVGWKGGDPSMPFVDIWQAGGQVTELDIVATLIKLNGGSFPVARAMADSAGPYPIAPGNPTILA